MLIQGRLTSDPEVSSTRGGDTMCKFRVAVNRKIGKDNEKTSFISVVVFGREAVNCGKYLSKGRVVNVTGRFETDDYTDKAGNPRTGFSVVALDVIFGSGGRDSEAGRDNSSNDRTSERDRDNSNRGGFSGDSRDSYSGSRQKAEKYMEKNRGRGYDS